MTSFNTKTRVIILSTLLICSKYSAIGDKITFFESVYANDIKVANTPDLLKTVTSAKEGLNNILFFNEKKFPKIKLKQFKKLLTTNKSDSISDMNNLFITCKSAISEEKQKKLELTTKKNMLELGKSVRDAMIELSNNLQTSPNSCDEGKIIRVCEETYKLMHKVIKLPSSNTVNPSAAGTSANTPRSTPNSSRRSSITSTDVNDAASAQASNLPATSQDPSVASTSANAPGIVGIPTTNSSLRSNIASTNVNDPASQQASNLPTTSTNTQNPSSIQTISSDEQQNPDQHAQVASEEHTSETPNVDTTAPQEVGLQGVITQSELQGAKPDLLNEQDNDDNCYTSDSETDDEEEQADNNVSQSTNTTASSNSADNQTQSSNSDIQSTTEDNIESGINNDDFTTALRPVSNNNIAIDDSSHNHFTPILHSTVYKARALVFPQISRKVSSDRTTQTVIGASCSSNLKRLKRYELEVKYLYSTTTIPKTNSNSKSNIYGLLINLKRQITTKLAAGVFYSPTSTNTTSINKVNNNSTSGCIDHLFGVYTSYAITPVTYLSNQIALGITAVDNNLGSNDNKPSNKKHPNYFIFDSFISHKISIDATKIISPELGISYYQSNTHIPYDIGDINNLSLNMGIKFQYKYKYNNFELCPSIKINHVHPLYANITENTKNLSNRASTPPTDLLRDLQSAFDPHSSIRFALSVRHKSIRFEGGYGFTTYHNIEHSYTHAFFAKLNLAL